ncbi:MAG: hypothetical protein QM759_17370 [Terricaulis sp.]
MTSVLIAIRDFLVAMALAWVGITLQAQPPQTDHAACSGQACQVDTQHH